MRNLLLYLVSALTVLHSMAFAQATPVDLKQLAYQIKDVCMPEGPIETSYIERGLTERGFILLEKTEGPAFSTYIFRRDDNDLGLNVMAKTRNQQLNYMTCNTIILEGVLDPLNALKSNFGNSGRWQFDSLFEYEGSRSIIYKSVASEASISFAKRSNKTSAFAIEYWQR